MTIKNPILRSLAGFAVFAILFAAAVFFLHLVGSLMEPWYAQEFPYSYAPAGFSFSDSMFLGVGTLLALAYIGLCFFLLSLVFHGIGNRLFGPPVEDTAGE